MIATIPARHRSGTVYCEARVGTSGVPPFAPIYCHQWRGLRVVTASDGSQHAYCPAEGHRERVARQAERLVTV